jgi:hypothetical protein
VLNVRDAASLQSGVARRGESPSGSARCDQS